MLAALCLAMVFAISLSSYIALCYVSLTMSTRSVMSSHSLELAETGLEQALYTQNYNGGNWTSAGWLVTVGAPISTQTSMTATMAMTSGGLVPVSDNPTPLNFGNGATGQVNLTIITNNSTGAVAEIQSQGLMTLPNGTATSSGATTVVSRTLTYTPTGLFTGPSSVSTPSTPVFVNAVAATTGIVQFKSAGTLDSYNSFNDSQSTPANQTYLAGATGNAGYSAVVLSQNVTSGSGTVNINDTVIYGYAVGYNLTSPSSTNWLSYGGAGKIVGSATGPTTFIDSSRVFTSPVPYQPVFAATPPGGSVALPLACCIGTTNVLSQTSSLGTLGATYPTIYNASGISLNGAVLTINGPVVIWVNTGGVTMLGTGQIIINSGGSLAIFADGGNVNIACTGTGGITNASAVPLAKNFALLSTANPSFAYTVDISQTTPFYGVIYFPYRNIFVNTTGATAPIYGSIVGESVYFSGSPTIHYDVALRTPDSTPADVAFYWLPSPVTVAGLVASVP
jgi:hypothetical protein